MALQTGPLRNSVTDGQERTTGKETLEKVRCNVASYVGQDEQLEWWNKMFQHNINNPMELGGVLWFYVSSCFSIGQALVLSNLMELE